MRQAFAGFLTIFRRALEQRLPPTDITGPTFEKNLNAAGLSFDGWFERMRWESRLYADVAVDTVAVLKREALIMTEAVVDAAENVLRHEFSLLGSGPFVPIDPEREPRPGYRPIDWYLDPVSSLRFPRDIPHKEWDLYKMRPGNADIKMPWELARCQHWVVLGQAWRLTDDERFAIEVLEELGDFMEVNPVGTGINWTCSMDVALRALNWAIGIELVKRCPALDEALLLPAYRHLFDHGVFIHNNLENKYEVTSNHFLSNVVGLYYLTSVFHDLPEARIWDRFCREALEREIEVQVLEDGADYESSVPYHRLVTELFLGAARLADFRKQPLSENYRRRLKKMVEFLAAVLRPDGLMPQVGDADDGRLHIFSGYGHWNPQDPRHLFGPAAFALGEPAWLKYAGPYGPWESAWWGFDIRSVEFGDGLLPPSTGLFPQAGLAVSRQQGHYLLVTNGIVGTKGFGNHKHNDQLGFELHLDGVPLVVDPGSFVYTSDPTARNLFRGTGYHNTLMIDNEEQNELRPEWLFRMFETARAEHIDFLETPKFVEYRGKHIGYQRLHGPVVHERRFRFLKDAGTLLIADILHGEGVHRLHWHYHLAPGVSVTRLGMGEFALETGGLVAYLSSLDGLGGVSGEAWYSPSYGTKVPCLTVDYEECLEVTGSVCRGFAIYTETGFDATAFRAALRDLAGMTQEN